MARFNWPRTDGATGHEVEVLEAARGVSNWCNPSLTAARCRITVNTTNPQTRAPNRFMGDVSHLHRGETPTGRARFVNTSRRTHHHDFIKRDDRTKQKKRTVHWAIGAMYLSNNLQTSIKRCFTLLAAILIEMAFAIIYIKVEISSFIEIFSATSGNNIVAKFNYQPITWTSTQIGTITCI